MIFKPAGNFFFHGEDFVLGFLSKNRPGFRNDKFIDALFEETPSVE